MIIIFQKFSIVTLSNTSLKKKKHIRDTAKHNWMHIVIESAKYQMLKNYISNRAEFHIS